MSRKRKLPSNVSYISDALNDNKLISPRQQLQCVLDDIADGSIKPKHLVVVYLEDGDVTPGFYAANFTMSAMVLALTRLVHRFNCWLDES